MADGRARRHETRLTAEPVLYAVAFAIAVALRFHDLGREPLGSSEAAHAWAAWTLATGGAEPGATVSPTPTSGLLFALQWLAFWLPGGGDDAVARWPSALMGSLCVLTPWLLREALGRSYALTLAALLTFDPVLTAMSRHATPGAATAFSTLLTLGCLGQAVTLWRGGAADEARLRRWLIAGGISSGMLIVSGPQAWTLLVLGTVTVLMLRPSVSEASARLVAAVASLTALLVATILLTHLPGGVHVAAGLTAWMRQWSSAGDVPRTLHGLMVGLLATQPLLAALAVVGAAFPPRGTRPLIGLVSALALAMTIGAGSSVDAELPFTLALALLAARGGTVVVALGRQTPVAWLVRGTAMVLLLLTAREAVGVATAAPQAAPAPGGSRTDAAPGIRRLTEDLADLGSWRTGDRHEHPILVLEDPRPDPLLRWHLREFRQVRRVLAIGPSLASMPAPARLVIAPDGPSTRTMDRRYTGTRYRVRRSGADRETVILWIELRDG
jgi:hypothetical protein